MTGEVGSLETRDAGASLHLLPRACPVCGSRDESQVFANADFDPARLDAFAFSSRKTPEYMHHRIIECAQCDLLYCSPAPTSTSLEHAYEAAAFDASEESRLASLTYARFLARLTLPDRDGALDIGAGDGAFLEQLLSFGFRNVVGVEPSKAPIEAARANVRSLIRHQPFRALDFSPSSFRLISCFQTMEHVYEPLELCRAAYRLLKEHGAIFLVCHDRRALPTRLLGLRSPIFDLEHLQLFSRKSLSSCLARAGFSRIEIVPVTNHYPLQYWTRLFPLPPALKSRALAALSATGLGRIRVGLRPGNIAAIGYR